MVLILIITRHLRKLTFPHSLFYPASLSEEEETQSDRQFITKPVNAKFIHLQYKNTNPQNNYRDKVVLILSWSFPG